MPFRLLVEFINHSRRSEANKSWMISLHRYLRQHLPVDSPIGKQYRSHCELIVRTQDNARLVSLTDMYQSLFSSRGSKRTRLARSPSSTIPYQGLNEFHYGLHRHWRQHPETMVQNDASTRTVCARLFGTIVEFEEVWPDNFNILEVTPWDGHRGHTPLSGTDASMMVIDAPLAPPQYSHDDAMDAIATMQEASENAVSPHTRQFHDEVRVSMDGARNDRGFFQHFTTRDGDARPDPFAKKPMKGVNSVLTVLGNSDYTPKDYAKIISLCYERMEMTQEKQDERNTRANQEAF